MIIQAETGGERGSDVDRKCDSDDYREIQSAKRVKRVTTISFTGTQGGRMSLLEPSIILCSNRNVIVRSALVKLIFGAVLLSNMVNLMVVLRSASSVLIL